MELLGPGLNSVDPNRLADLCRRYQIRELAVFGSTARGERKPDSDVDVVVEFEEGTERGLGYFVLEEELGALFGQRVDLATKKWLKPSVREKVLRDARVLYAA